LTTTLTNDGTLLPAGVYYFTPLVYGNATGTGNVTTLTLDPACTYTGQSVMITLYAAGDPLCNVGLNELNAAQLSMNAYQVNENEVSLNLVSAKQTKVAVNVFDLAGRLVLNESLSLSQGANSHLLDISNLGAGTYVIRVSDNNSVVTGKMVRY
jgi:Secretion system C-terminal sorting domain